MRLWTTAESVEVEVDVTFDEILDEFSKRVDGGDAASYKKTVAAVDHMTRLLASVPDEAIEKLTQEARETLCERLMNEAARYDPAI